MNPTVTGNPGAGGNGIRLRAAHYSATTYPFAGSEVSPSAAAAILADRVIEDARAVLDHVGEDAPHFMLSSTVLWCNLLQSCEIGDAFRRRLRAVTGNEPPLVNAYECAGWGYIFRHLQRLSPARRRPLLLTIADVDVLNLQGWEYGAQWGRSGFGLTTLCVDGYDSSEDTVLTGSARSDKAWLEFARRLAAFAARYQDARVFPPFFPEPLRAQLEHILPKDRLSPNLHSIYGHSFGGDPWIGVVASARERRPAEAGPVIVASLALNGYFCAARIALTPETRLSASGWEARPQ